jgi:hypothetical protein
MNMIPRLIATALQAARFAAYTLSSGIKKK